MEKTVIYLFTNKRTSKRVSDFAIEITAIDLKLGTNGVLK